MNPRRKRQAELGRAWNVSNVSVSSRVFPLSRVCIARIFDRIDGAEASREINDSRRIWLLIQRRVCLIFVWPSIGDKMIRFSFDGRSYFLRVGNNFQRAFINKKKILRWQIKFDFIEEELIQRKNCGNVYIFIYIRPLFTFFDKKMLPYSSRNSIKSLSKFRYPVIHFLPSQFFKKLPFKILNLAV